MPLIMQLTADIIAQHLGGRVSGPGDVLVSDFAKIESAKPGTITFLSNPKYTPYLYSTEASVVIVGKDFVPEQEVKATLIHVDDPYNALAQLLNVAAAYLKPQPTGIEQPCHIAEGVELEGDCYVGAFAYIAPGVKLGKNVKIYPNVYIGHNVTIGDDCVLYPGVKIYYGCKLGKRCVIHAGTVIGSDGFGFAPDAQGVYHKIEQIGIVELADDVEIGANATIDRSTMGRTYIDRGVKLDNLVQVAHNVEIGHDTVMASQTGVAGSTKIGANCMVGGQVGFAGHITVGDRVVIGAQTGVPNNVEDGARIMGYPAMPARDFARIVASQKQLPRIVRLVDQLEKKINQSEN